jgi:cephalosporin hydroxylase
MSDPVDPIVEFRSEVEERVAGYADDQQVHVLSKDFMVWSCYNKYTYNFSWMGMPIFQYPQDLVLMQELIWDQKPDVIVEMGVARGGSLVYYASLLELIGSGRVVGVDIEIREHNRKAILGHPMAPRITMIEGSSTDVEVQRLVRDEVAGAERVMVVLDSKHTHDHVLGELEGYHDLVSVGGYLVVFDTTVQTFDDEVLVDLQTQYRFAPWGKDSNPHSALTEFLQAHPEFEMEPAWHRKALITNCFEGILRRRDV